MTNFLSKFRLRKESTLDQFKEILRKKHAAYVLITCDPPNEQGDMQVEMDFEGDEVLASYLLENAQQVFGERLKEPKVPIECNS